MWRELNRATFRKGGGICSASSYGQRSMSMEIVVREHHWMLRSRHPFCLLDEAQLRIDVMVVVGVVSPPSSAPMGVMTGAANGSRSE